MSIIHEDDNFYIVESYQDNYLFALLYDIGKFESTYGAEFVQLLQMGEEYSTSNPIMLFRKRPSVWHVLSNRFRNIDPTEFNRLYNGEFKCEGDQE